MNKTWRRRLIFLAIVVVSLFGAALLARKFGEFYARREVEAQLRKFNDGPVEFGELKLGWRQTVASNIRLLDPVDGDAWLRADQVVAKISFWDAVLGNVQLQNMIVRRGRLTLRFDAAGNLITQLPSLPADEPLPCESVRFDDTSLVVERAGSPPLVANEIDGRLQANLNGIEATATIGAALGSAWTLEMTHSEVTQLKLATTEFRAAGRDLSQLPGVPASIASIEQVAGAASISVQLDPTKANRFVSRAEATLTSLRATALTREWQLTNGTASFSLQDQVVRMTTLTGDIAGGRARLAGEFNLVDEAGSISGDVERVNLAELPEAWHVPPLLQGRLSADLTLQLKIVDREVVVAGATRGRIEDVEVAGLGIDPIQVELTLAEQKLSEERVGTAKVSLGVTALDVGEFLASLDRTALALPDVPRGKLTAALTLTVPLQALGNPGEYRGEGRLSTEQITIRQQSVNDVQANLRIEAGKVSLEQATFVIAGGTAQGHISAEMESGALTAELTVETLSLAQLAKAAATSSTAIDGTVDANVTLRGSWRELAELDTWSARGDARSDNIELAGQLLESARASFQLARGVLRLEALRAARKGAEFEGHAALDLHPPHTFEAQLTASDLDVARGLQEFPHATRFAKLQGQAAIDAHLSGTLEPWHWQADGDAKFDSLVFDPWRVERGEMQWELDAERLQISKLDVDAWGGTLSATVAIPLGAAPIESSGTFTELASESLLKLPHDGVTLSGPVSGVFSLTLPKSEPSNLAARIEFSGPRLDAESFEVSELMGTATYDAGAVKLRMRGSALGSQLALDGSGRWDAGDGGVQFDGRIVAEGIELAALGPLATHRELGHVQGRVDVDMTVAVRGPEWTTSGDGTASIRDLRWNRIDVARSIQARITLSKDVLVVRNVAARLHEGTARGEMTIPLAATRSGSFRLVLDRVRARRILALWPEWEGVADGDLNVLVEGRMGRRWYGSARVQMSRSAVAGIPLQRVMVPLNWTFSPETDRFHLSTREASAYVGGGRVTANLELTLGDQLTVKCAGRVHAVELRTLLKGVPGTNSMIDGDLTGDFNFAGRNVRKIGDLTGSYQVKLVQARVMLLPVFDDLASALGGGSLTGRFDKSESRGRLAKGGVIHVDEMFLANSEIQMEVQGRVWLTGRVELDVTAHTGEFEATTLLGQLVRSPLRYLDPVGIGLLIRANDFLQRRLLYFHVGGTARNPTIRARASEFLQQEVVLFFLDEASGQLLR